MKSCKILLQKLSSRTHRVAAGGKILGIHAQDIRSLKILIPVKNAFRISTAVIKRYALHAVQIQNLLPYLLADYRNPFRYRIIIRKIIRPVPLVNLYIYRIISCPQQVFLNLFIRSLNRGNDRNDGGNTDNNTKHRQEGTHFM